MVNVSISWPNGISIDYQVLKLPSARTLSTINTLTLSEAPLRHNPKHHQYLNTI